MIARCRSVACPKRVGGSEKLVGQQWGMRSIACDLVSIGVLE